MIAARRARYARSGLTLSPALGLDSIAHTAPAAIETDPEPSRGPAQRVAIGVSAVLTLLGLILGTFFIYEFFGSGLLQSRSRSVLAESLKESLAKGPSGPAVKLVPGEPMGVIEIPAIGLNTLVIEGTSPGDLEKGAGHFRGSSLPGRAGNAVIAGRRTTYSAPFRSIDKLKPKDKIKVSTALGAATYIVQSKKVVRAGQPDAVAQTVNNRLTLISSHPKYLARERLAVTAVLEGKPIAGPVEAGPIMVADKQSGLSGDSGAFGPLILWFELLIVILGLAWVVYRRWSGWACYLISTPIILAVLFQVYGQLSRLLPATL